MEMVGDGWSGPMSMESGLFFLFFFIWFVWAAPPHDGHFTSTPVVSSSKVR